MGPDLRSCGADCARGFCDELCIRVLASKECFRVCGNNSSTFNRPTQDRPSSLEAYHRAAMDTSPETRHNVPTKAQSLDDKSPQAKQCTLDGALYQSSARKATCCAGAQHANGDDSCTASTLVLPGVATTTTQSCCAKSPVRVDACHQELDIRQRVTSRSAKKDYNGAACCKEQRSSLFESNHEGHDQIQGKKNQCCSEKSPASVLSSVEHYKSSTTASSCAEHLQAAFDKFESLLLRGFCLCRSVIDQEDSCCSLIMKDEHHGPKSLVQQNAGVPGRKPCTKHIKPGSQMPEKACCSVKYPVPNHGTKLVDSRTTELDIEQGVKKTSISLQVTGMTCTGCSTKIRNVLEKVHGVSEIHVTFVNGTISFQLDESLITQEEIVLLLGQRTGFSFVPLIIDTQTLDLLVQITHYKAALAIASARFQHVEDLTKSCLRIHYNPATIGAREIISTIPGAALAPAWSIKGATPHLFALRVPFTLFLLATCFTIPIAVLSWANTGISSDTSSLISLVLASIVQLLAVPEFYIPAFRALIYSRIVEMDMLVVISISAAYGYSVIAFGLTRAGFELYEPEFFETGALLITLVLLGRLISAYARSKAISAVSARSLQMHTAELLNESGKQTIDARLLHLDDTIVVSPHSNVVTDGLVVDGSSLVDESMLTGEHIPIERTIGDSVLAGTVNGASTLIVKVQRLPGMNTISDIANSVEVALESKCKTQDLADLIASWFILTVVIISLIVFVVWMLVATLVQGQGAGYAAGKAVTYSIAVLAISCPCALGLAVPMVLVIAGGVSAQAGIFVKRANVFEKAHAVTDVVFDKTGTLTTKNLDVVQELFLGKHLSFSECDALTMALLKDNQHPVSEAVMKFLACRSPPSGTSPVKLDKVESRPGHGIQATYQHDKKLRAGNPYWLEIMDRPEIMSLSAQGLSMLCIMLDDEVLTIFGLRSSLRDGVSDLLAHLQARGIDCHLVSGDGPGPVNDVGAAVGILKGNTASRQSPLHKQEYVKQLMSKGRRVLFCGDGTNDAVAVAQADIGVQIGGTTSDVTRASADVVLINENLGNILQLIDASKRAYNRIVFNFVWAAVYNVFAILLASGAFVKFRIAPAYAGIGELVSVLPVILAALTLMFYRKKT